MTVKEINLFRRRAGLPEFPEAPPEFIAGWRKGYYDGGEHDCRMFEPTAEDAWTQYLIETDPKYRGSS